MTAINRRRFLQLFGAGAATAASSLAYGHAMHDSGNKAQRVVVIGGGFGGSTCARYLRHFDPDLEVTLINPSDTYTTCPFSNLVLGGERDLASITHDLSQLEHHHGVRLVQRWVESIDADGHRVVLDDGSAIGYDRLVVSPGIDLRWDAVEGYDQAAQEAMPHAWRPGEQTLLLRRQLEAMSDGGVVVIAPPANPFRCPPGPYERASLIAHYLKHHKPRSKILILDAKDAFAKQGLFQTGWETLYPGMIEWVPGIEGGTVERVDAATGEVFTPSGRYRGDVVNLIPPQHAGAIARNTGLTDDSGWCPVNQQTFESLQIPHIHVIGDASIAGAMPKAGFAANSQAKVCAAAVVAALHGFDPTEPSWSSTCYSLVGPEYGISVSAVYRLDNGSIVASEGAGVSPGEADDHFRQLEAVYARGWYDNITAEMYG
ncbi:NAD(P)/FAD-dependent oxidoreductase [Thioalkalivibrio paradoxus]|uniref:Cytochrome C n=1 Tax=Thioalkalivibrio paradoxus ARh 1 TaxID=713585 RepID=W0DP88_9GAMM|nr:NAD(P)/FAD-dependent oxidoreductase [Thioalkalivibrio paradoxus]AHE99072.1 cytochrome C [Thioalkalivibrio paradoxus ARh 1]